MLPNALSYCLFMISCFGALQERLIFLDSCPRQCDCYNAPEDGITGSTATSIICHDSLTVLNHLTFRPKIINTMVLQKGEFSSPSLLQIINRLKKYYVISLVLENFIPSISQKNNIFEMFDYQTLKYLSIYKSTLEIGSEAKFSWSFIQLFTNLLVLNIEDSQLYFLDASFSSLQLKRVNTLIIRNCQLTFIERDAFANGKESLQKLILASNNLKNIIWLTSQSANVWQRLEHLDLSSNQLSHLPIDLKSKLPNVEVLNLANNLFIQLTFQFIQPWFTIKELSLLTLSNEVAAFQKTLYFTKDMEWIKSLADIDIKADFVLNELTHGFSYLCPTVNAPVNNWQELMSSCKSSYDFNPVHMYFNSKGQLVFGSNEISLPFLVSGLNIDWKDVIIATTSEEFTQNHQSFLQILQSTKGKNAIRMPLFDEQMLAYYFEDIEISDYEIDLFIDQVVDYLDEAAAEEKYVIAVLWQYETVERYIRKADPLVSFTSPLFESKVIAKLITQISTHPALIGIEIVSQFLSGQLTEEEDLVTWPNSACETDPIQIMKAVEPYLIFLGFNAEAVKKSSAEKAIGVSIDASCRSCFAFAYQKTCLRGFTGSINFVTLITVVANAAKEPYSYLNYEENRKIIFADDDHSTGIFYVIDGKPGKDFDDTILGIQPYSAGYFNM